MFIPFVIKTGDSRIISTFFSLNMAMLIAGDVVRDRRKFCLSHILIMSLMFGITIVLAEEAVVVPFIFSIF